MTQRRSTCGRRLQASFDSSSGEHGLDATGDIDGETAHSGVVVERRAGGYVGGDVGDVHPRPDAVLLAPQAEGVVEVLRLVGSDREGEEVTEVDPVGLVVRRRRRHGRMLSAHAKVPEEALQHGLDVACGPRTRSRGHVRGRADDDQVARRSVSQALCRLDRHPAFEVRLGGGACPGAKLAAQLGHSGRSRALGGAVGHAPSSFLASAEDRRIDRAIWIASSCPRWRVSPPPPVGPSPGWYAPAG